MCNKDLVDSVRSFDIALSGSKATMYCGPESDDKLFRC